VTRGRARQVAVALTLFGAGCASTPKSAPLVDPAPASRPIATNPEPLARLIAEADEDMRRGEAELRDGHLNQARAAFDRAIARYLEAPGGAYSNPRLAEAYRRTLETVHLRDIEAIAAGDGFAESVPEPAAIDELGNLPIEPAPVPSEETRRVTQAVVQAEQNDLPIELNDKVLACVDLYQGRLRDWFGSALARGGRYLPHIREVFAAEGIPQDLAYAALVESAFRPAALSRAKARGVWQFIPATGRRYGLQQDWWVDERSDPEKATHAAAQYFKQLYALFGDWNLALAAYNAGEGKIQRLIARFGTRDFWELSTRRGRGTLRAETRNYVPMIHAAIVVAKAPEKYGFVPEPEPALAYDAVPVDGAVDLRTIAECAGSPLADVRGLNPELRRLATPAGRTFEVKVPTGTGETLRECLARLPAEKRVSFRTHVVGRGQTLVSIARQYGTRAEDIAQANDIRSGRRLARGTQLIIPVPSHARATPPAALEAAARRARAEANTSPDLTRLRHRVRRGDTLASIAERYGTTVADIKAWNRLRGTRIAAGGVLTIYTQR
jgi:membrane-bound lytic murein transglycosylase D